MHLLTKVPLAVRQLRGEILLPANGQQTTRFQNNEQP
jgi:hypothetical protein